MIAEIKRKFRELPALLDLKPEQTPKKFRVKDAENLI